MNPKVIKKINKLWKGVYPYLARYIIDLCGRQEGDALELGPFSGGIAKELLSLSSAWKVVVAGEPQEVFDPLKKEIKGTPVAERMMIRPSPLSPLTFMDQSFDLVIFRGALFFLTPTILREAYRVLRPRGLAILGGGYGPYTPRSVMEEIAQESKRLNKLLGKRWITEEELVGMVQEASLGEEAEISQRGGLWVILKKKETWGERDLTLSEALCLTNHEVISLVGGGGKTTLMFSLAKELRGKGLKIITTTTTKIFEPAAGQTPCLVIEEDQKQAIELVKEGLNCHGHVTLAAKRFPGGKIGGVNPDLVGRIAQELQVDHLIVEADGAKGLPIKAPGDHEPVVPQTTSTLIPIVGIDALGRPLGEEEAFRPGRIAELTGARMGDPITPPIVATLITHPHGLIKGAPLRARITPFLNKVETSEQERRATEVAHEVLRNGDRRIGMVVLGKLFYHHPIVKVIRREK